MTGGFKRDSARSTWPRPELVLLPLGLRLAWGGEELPRQEAIRVGLRGAVFFRDLDASIWGRLPEDRVSRLVAPLVERLVRKRLRQRNRFADRQLPLVPGLAENIEVVDLVPELSDSLIEAVRRLIARTGPNLRCGDLTAALLLKVGGFGTSGVLEIGSVAEFLSPSEAGVRSERTPVEVLPTGANNGQTCNSSEEGERELRWAVVDSPAGTQGHYVHFSRAWPRIGLPLLPEPMRAGWADRKIRFSTAGEGSSRESIKVADLGREIWSRFSEETVRTRIARVVVRDLVAPALSLRKDPVFEKLLFPRAQVRWRDVDSLPFSRRSRNILMNLLGEPHQPRSLGAITLGDFAKVRGVGATVFLEISTVIEGLAGPPGGGGAAAELTEAQQAPHLPYALLGNVDRGWPRRGHALLPKPMLQAWSQLPVDLSGLGEGADKKAVSVGELGPEIWSRLPEETIRSRIAPYVLAELVTPALLSRRDPVFWESLFPGARFSAKSLAALPLSSRAHNILMNRLGDWYSPSNLAKISIGEFISAKGVGARVFLELATAIEAVGESSGEGVSAGATSPAAEAESSGGPLAESRTRARQRLSALLERLQRENWGDRDPRFISLGRFGLRSFLHELTTTIEWATTLEETSSGGQRIDEVHAFLDELEQEPLEEALARLVAGVVRREHFRPLLRRLGWDGAGGCTLEEAASELGLTRERVRQIEVKLLRKLTGVRRFSQLDAALSVLRQVASDPLLDPANELERNGTVASRFLPYGVLKAAFAFGRAVELDAKMGSSALKVSASPSERAVHRALASLRTSGNVGTIQTVLSRLADEEGVQIPEDRAIALLGLSERIVWLDQGRTWLWHRASHGGSRYLNYARKILAVSPVISLEALRDGVFRHYRTRTHPLPRLVFEELLRVGGLEVRDGKVLSEPGDPAHKLEGSDALLASLLAGLGGVAHLSELLKPWQAAGYTTVTLTMGLGNAPFIERLAPGIYGLRGQRVDPARVAALRKAPRERAAVKDWGWTQDGVLWLAQSTTVALLTSKVIHFPVAIRRVLTPTRFALWGVDGERFGTLVVGEDGLAWGLGQYFRHHAPEEGEVLLIVFSPASATAVVQVGGKDLLALYQEGLGLGPGPLLAVESEE